MNQVLETASAKEAVGQSSARSIGTTRLVGFLMLFTIPLYFLCAEFLSRNQERIILPLIKNVLTLVAVLTFLAALVLRFRFMPEVSRATSPAEKAMLVSRLRTVSIQGMAWSESVVVCGFLLRLLGASRNYTLPFYLLSFFGILLFLRGSTIETTRISAEPPIPGAPS